MPVRVKFEVFMQDESIIIGKQNFTPLFLKSKCKLRALEITDDNILPIFLHQIEFMFTNESNSVFMAIHSCIIN